MNDFATLAALAAQLGEQQRDVKAKQDVLITTVLALVLAHPDKEELRTSFQRAWQKFGSPIEMWQHSPEAVDAIRDLLAFVEMALGKPLGVCPPRP